MGTPKITVIIPTRERCDVLEKSLKTATSQDYDNLEIIVSDNFSTDATAQVVRGANDRRVKYINTGKRISMSHNWEFAVSSVTDGWLTIIGDDDGLLPGALNKVAELMRSSDVQAIRSDLCQYNWPSYLGTEFGTLEVPLSAGHEVRSSKDWLAKVVNGQSHYHQLPMLYNGGFVAVEVLKRIKSKTGAFYKSFTPDVYSGISIAATVDRYVYSHEPFAINGASRHSNGASFFSPSSKSEGSPAQVFCSEENIAFHPALPLCADGSYPPSIQALIYESYLQAEQLGVSPPDREMHRRQLELVLATSGNHHAALAAWGEIFARMHGLDYGSIEERAGRSALAMQLASFPGRTARRFNTYTAKFPEFRVRDIYEASIAAGKIRDAIPGGLKRTRLLADFVIDRMFHADRRCA